MSAGALRVPSGFSSSKGPEMIEYRCDRCHRAIDVENEVRYVVKMEIMAALEPSYDATDAGDRDHLLEIHEILERGDDAESELIGDEIFQARRYDLCPECHKKFLAAPLGREAAAQLGFSDN